MLSWFQCVLLKGGHRYGRWWWADRHDGAGTHRLCEECAALCTPANKHRWASRSRDRGPLVQEAATYRVERGGEVSPKLATQAEVEEFLVACGLQREGSDWEAALAGVPVDIDGAQIRFARVGPAPAAPAVRFLSASMPNLFIGLLFVGYCLYGLATIAPTPENLPWRPLIDPHWVLGLGALFGACVAALAIRRGLAAVRPLGEPVDNAPEDGQ